MSATSLRPIDINRLPNHLFERVRVNQNAPVGTGGGFVLDWMHHAVRSHENPALDTALFVGAQIESPGLAYRGLGGRHPFNSDRHHTFIMEGAREVQEQQERGISYALRRAARRLAHRCRIRITQGGKEVDPSTFKGPIRLTLKS
jgi:hypothetical protein